MHENLMGAMLMKIVILLRENQSHITKNRTKIWSQNGTSSNIRLEDYFLSNDNLITKWHYFFGMKIGPTKLWKVNYENSMICSKIFRATRATWKIISFLNWKSDRRITNYYIPRTSFGTLGQNWFERRGLKGIRKTWNEIALNFASNSAVL